MSNKRKISFTLGVSQAIRDSLRRPVLVLAPFCFMNITTCIQLYMEHHGQKPTTVRLAVQWAFNVGLINDAERIGMTMASVTMDVA